MESKEKKIILSKEAPAAIGPYSQATSFKNFIFTSGQIALDPLSMKVVSGGIKEQTEQVMKNLLEVLREAGGDASMILKTTCFLSDMNDYAGFNEVYAKYLGTDNFPARSCVQVSKLPLGVLVEVEAIAFKK